MLSKVLALAIFMASTQAFTIKISPKANGELKECLAGTSDWFGNYKLDVSPMPIALANGKEVTLDGEITLKQAIEQGSKVVIKVTQEIPWVGNIPIPCAEVVTYFFIFLLLSKIFTYFILGQTWCAPWILHLRYW